MKRELKQPRKDVLREWLRDAASKIETLQGRLVWWEERHEQAVQDEIAALRAMPPWGWLVPAFLAGGFVVAVIEGLLA
jgi:hypothetical protein